MTTQLETLQRARAIEDMKQARDHLRSAALYLAPQRGKLEIAESLIYAAILDAEAPRTPDPVVMTGQGDFTRTWPRPPAPASSIKE